MGNLNRVVYLTQEDYDTLRAEGSVTKNGKTITFNQNDLYVTSSTSVVPLSNSAANWAVNTTFYPKAGEIIIYEADANNPIPRIKIGDGAHLVKDLPFATAIYLDATQNNSGLMSAADKTKLDGLPSSALVPDSIAIVANGNTHAAITSGQFVYVRNHGTLAEGLYQASANIAQNAALSTSNLTAVSGGGLNALNSNLTSLSEQIGTLDSKVVGIDISNNADLNNYTTPGTYTINSAGIAQSLSHRPWNLISNAILEVKKAGNTVIQIIHENYYGHLVQRDYDGTSWSNWYTPVHSVGSFSGNQTLDDLRTKVEDTGKVIGYMVDSLITGWSTIETYVSPSGTYRSIKVTNASKIVYTQTSNGGTSWTTGSVALS